MLTIIYFFVSNAILNYEIPLIFFKVRFLEGLNETLRFLSPLLSSSFSLIYFANIDSTPSFSPSFLKGKPKTFYLILDNYARAVLHQQRNGRKGSSWNFWVQCRWQSHKTYRIEWRSWSIAINTKADDHQWDYERST